MTDKEIIETLETCHNIDGECTQCCLTKDNNCRCTLNRHAIYLIKRQQAEIERLSKKNEELAEILSNTIRIRYAEAKAEAIKEFAERLKGIVENDLCLTENETDYLCMRIDDETKEMVGKNNEV